jgi:FMN phosphatase YigB (HAD superfamily)
MIDGEGCSVLRRNLDDLRSPIENIELISTDVFDTLLLRHGKAQRSRTVAAEIRFARLLKEHGLTVRAEDLVRVRLLAEKFAYRALNIGGGAGEVRLTDIIRWQLAVLGLPQSLGEKRLAIELEVEKTALSANGALAVLLRRHRQSGIRVVAVSDTALPASRLAELIDHFHGPGLIDKIYSSADIGASKRYGGLFSAVLEAEAVAASRMLHIGDDPVADVSVPKAMGINTVHLPKSRLARYVARVDGATTEAIRHIRRRLERGSPQIPGPSDQISFGRDVFGPIVAEFCLFIWLYAQQANVGGDAAMLFCARGGIGIREAFERLLTALRLPLDLKRDNILVSRLVAARSAIITRSPAVLDELGREFKGSSFASVARALGGRSQELPASWQQTFDKARFFPMLDTPEGREVFNDIRSQNDLFIRHLQQVSGEAERIILCDTGLYGSTQRLLAAGLPDHSFETIQFARCNYKGLSEEHFAQVAGLVVEQNLYNPFKVETVVLRYWQIIESLFEPSVPSVCHLSADANGRIVANSGDIGYGKLDPSHGNPLLSGVLQYIDRAKDGSQVMREAEYAWLRLKQAITNPTPLDVVALGVGARSVDFGRSEVVQVLNQSDTAEITGKLMSVKAQLWREGAIAREFPRLKPALLRALEMAHVVRGVSARLNR